MARSSIYVGEIAHRSPIPNASRIGNIIVSGLIRGFDPSTSKLAATLEQQCAFMFLHMRQCAEAGGDGRGHRQGDGVDGEARARAGERRVGEDVSRPRVAPARQIMEVPMEAGVLVQCDFMAVIEPVT
jgi:hypothetical protein